MPIPRSPPGSCGKWSHRKSAHKAAVASDKADYGKCRSQRRAAAELEPIGRLRIDTPRLCSWEASWSRAAASPSPQQTPGAAAGAPGAEIHGDPYFGKSKKRAASKKGHGIRVEKTSS